MRSLRSPVPAAARRLPDISLACFCASMSHRRARRTCTGGWGRGYRRCRSARDVQAGWSAQCNVWAGREAALRLATAAPRPAAPPPMCTRAHAQQGRRSDGPARRGRGRRRRRTRSADALLRCCERSFWQVTTRPLGRCVMRTALSVTLTCCPPAPLARMVSTRRSSSRTSTSAWWSGRQQRWRRWWRWSVGGCGAGTTLIPRRQGLTHPSAQRRRRRCVQ
jgi:hypothetical protein